MRGRLAWRRGGVAVPRPLLVLGLAGCGLIDASSSACSNPPGFTGAATCPGTGRGRFVLAENDDLGTDFSAAFWTAKLRDECPPQLMGPCKVKQCTPLSSGSTPGQLEAGHLFFTGPLATFEIPLTPDPSYSTMAMPGLLFRPGAGLRIWATGGTFPAFSTTFCYEGRATFTSPSVAPPSATVIDRGQDLVVTWQGLGVGVAELEIDDQTQADFGFTARLPARRGDGDDSERGARARQPGPAHAEGHAEGPRGDRRRRCVCRRRDRHRRTGAGAHARRGRGRVSVIDGRAGGYSSVKDLSRLPRDG